jgi:hypothetical protein
MPAQKLRTVWFTQYTASLIFRCILGCGIGAVLWGTVMSLIMGGPVISWAIGGALWGIAMLALTAPLVLVGFRELVVRLSPFAVTDFDERLTEVVRPLKFSVEQPSPYCYICTPSHRLAAVRKHAVLEVRLHPAGIDLIGPALLVSGIKKRLLKSQK